MKQGFLTPAMMMLFIVFGILMLLPFVASFIMPWFKYIMMGFFCILIYTFVRGIIGPGAMTWVISLVLIYIFVWKFWWLFAPAYMIYMIVGFGLASVIIFALPHGGMGTAAKSRVM